MTVTISPWIFFLNCRLQMFANCSEPRFHSLNFRLRKQLFWSSRIWITAPVPVVPSLKGTVVSNVTLA